MPLCCCHADAAICLLITPVDYFAGCCRHADGAIMPERLVLAFAPLRYWDEYATMMLEGAFI